MSLTHFRPDQIHPTTFIAPDAVVVGNVTLGADVGVWFHAVLRGDLEPIIVHARTNIQDGCILHTDLGFPTTIYEGVTVGHGAVVHGATVHANTLIGMRATLLNGVIVGENCIVGAGALLTQGKHFPAGHLIIGVPGRVIRPLTEEEIERNRHSAQEYVEHAHKFRDAYK
jgi:carbonic anhydrase/acetyltransferase-like protein (isoleucine patch superfamily)